MAHTLSPPSTESLTCDVVLADGATVHIRPIHPDDAARLVAFHGRLSPDSIYLRYFSTHPHLTTKEVERFTCVDFVDRVALVATLNGEIVAVGRYDRLPERRAEAEVAFVVEDAQQSRGISTLLLEHLAGYARNHGISVFRAETLWQNDAMLRVFRQAGFVETTSHDGGIVDITMDIRPSASLTAAIEARDAAATANSVRHMIEPRSVAVIGATSKAGSIGFQVLNNIVAGGFTGAVYPVNPHEATIVGLTAYPTVGDIPGDVDAAVVCIPRDGVAEVARQCAAKGVHGLIVISAGFAETDESGREDQDQLLAIARSSGMRIIGPNCMGVIGHSDHGLFNATFAPGRPTSGGIAFASQSGGLGIAVLGEASSRGTGISSFVSMGNKADVSGNDLLQFWAQDPRTDVVLMYLESFGNPRRFARIARHVSETKPIIAVKAGRSRSGQRAASSHTAALASADTAVDALFAQSGVIRVDTLSEMFDTAQVLSSQPLPNGRRVAIVTNAGGPGILAADACEAAGLEVPQLGPETQSALKRFLPHTAATSNPVDMIASASAADYENAIRVVLDEPTIDAVIVVFVPPLVTEADDVASAISRVSAGAAKPLVATFLGMTVTPEVLLRDQVVPTFRFPEPAARALARACDYGAWRARRRGHVTAFSDADPESTSALITKVLTGSPTGRWLSPDETNSLLSSYGIPVSPTRVVCSAQQADFAAKQIGAPVAVKAFGRDLLHKSDKGGVRLNVAPGQAGEVFLQLSEDLGTVMDAAIVQPMAPEGVETIVGVLTDPVFGPLIMFGMGGVTVELFKDRSFRSLPLTDEDAGQLVRSLKGTPMLFGYRNSPATDVESLITLVERVASLAEAHPEISEVDLNPVIVHSSGAVAVDARIRLAPAPAPAPWDPTIRRLG